MAVAYASIGTVGTGSTSVTAGTPASLATGDGVLIHVMTKPDTATINTPSGWTLVSDVAGGGGTTGNGVGPTRQATFFREKDGTWTTVPAVSITGGNSSAAVASRWTKGAGTTWDIAGATGAYGTSGTTTNASTTLGNNPGIASGDMVAVGFSNMDEAPTWSAQSISAAGATFGSITERSEAVETTTGNDVGGMLFTAACTAGTATAAAVVGGTLSIAGRGTAALTRLREVASGPSAINVAPTGVAGASGEGTTVTHVNSTTTGNSSMSSSSKSVAVPAGIQADDIVLLTFDAWQIGSGAITPPSGFAVLDDDTSGTMRMVTWWKRATGSDSGNYQVTFTGSSIWSTLIASAYRGVSTSWTPSGLANSEVGTGSAPPSVTVTTTGPSMLWWRECNDQPAASRTPPTSPGAFIQRTGDDCSSVADYLDSGSGSRVISGATDTAGGADRVVHAVALVGEQATAAFGSPTVNITSTVNAQPSGISSTETLGTPVASTPGGPVTASPSGIASSEAFGTPSSPPTYIGPFVADVSADGRHLVDQSGNTVFNFFDTLWPMVQIAGRDSSGDWQADVDHWIDTRSAQGFTGLKFCLLAQVISGAPADLLTHDDVSPFDTNSPTTANIGNLNNTYWQRVDYIVDQAAAAGMTCWMHVMYKDDVSAPSGTGWLQGHTNTEYTNFGTALADRYKDKPNIVWVYGGDYFDESASSMQLINTAMKAAGDNHLVTVQNYSDSAGGTYWTTSRQEGPSVSELTLGNAIAEVDSVYIYQNLHLGAKQAWQDTPTLPVIYYDGYYDQNSGTAATRLRRDMGWALTSGVNASHYGSEANWSMGSGWRSTLTATAGVQHIVSMRNSITALDRWDELVPDFATDFITSGRGSGTSYITGAKTSDGGLAVVYMPNATGTSVTVNNANLAASYTAKWVDPTNGTVVPTASGSTYQKTGANAAGGTDWFLVLEESNVISASPSAIASGESFGSSVATSQLASSPSAIASAQAFGTQALASVLTSAPSAIASAEAFGALSVATGLTVNPSAIASAFAAGSPLALLSIPVQPAGIASVAALGSPNVSGVLNVSPASIASLLAVGTPNISGGLTISPTAIATALAFGSPSISTMLTVSPSGIITAQALGSPSVGNIVIASPLGVASAAAVGTPALSTVLLITPTGIASALAFGSPSHSSILTLVPSGIASVESFGSPSMLGGPFLVTPVGIASEATVGLVQINGEIEFVGWGIPMGINL